MPSAWPRKQVIALLYPIVQVKLRTQPLLIWQSQQQQDKSRPALFAALKELQNTTDCLQLPSSWEIMRYTPAGMHLLTSKVEVRLGK